MFPLGVLRKSGYQGLYPEELFLDFNDDFENKGSFETAVSNVGTNQNPTYSATEAVVSGKSILMQGVTLRLVDTASLAVGDVSFEMGFRVKFTAISGGLVRKENVGGGLTGWGLSHYNGRLTLSTRENNNIIATVATDYFIFSTDTVWDVKIIYDSTTHTLFFYRNNVLVNQGAITILGNPSGIFSLNGDQADPYHMDNFYFKLL